MRASVSFAVGCLLTVGLSWAQETQDEPTRQEIAQAYRAKSGEAGASPASGWERRRIKKIRGWVLNFKRVSENRATGILTRQYDAVARKNGLCAGYRIVDSMPVLPDSRLKPTVAVEPSEVKACE